MEQDDTLYYMHDIDGILIEWRTLEGINFGIPYLNIIPKGPVKPVYSLLKKHFDLRKFSKESLSVLKRCVGSRLCYDGGWDTWVAFIPEFDLRNELSSVDFPLMAVKALTNLRILFQKLMKEQIGKDSMNITLSKNNLNNLCYVRVLPNEQSNVLSLLQLSIESTDVAVQGMKKMLFSFRFGEKYSSDLQLPIKSHGSVVDVSVHIGLSVRAIISQEDTEELEMSMFWSRVGLKEIVGRRGALTSAYSFTECVNFQSNLDGREMDISGELRRLCIYPDRLRFVQLYADIPHRRPKVRFHPVSGAVFAIPGVVNKRGGLETDAQNYLSEVSNNFEQITGSHCRLEMVVSLPEDCTYIKPSSILPFRHLSEMLEKYPLIVPFVHPEFPKILRNIGMSLVNELRNDYMLSNGTGNSEVVWRSYQRELAIEKLLWGQPFCTMSHRYSVNLGPGLAYPTRSETDLHGFLSLCESTTCCLDEYSSPPCCIYSRSDTVQKQLKKTFGFTDLLGGSKNALGRRLVFLLVQELHETGCSYESFNNFLLKLKSSVVSDKYRIVGGTSRKQLAKMIGQVEKAKYPMVFGHLIKLLKTKGADTISALKEGFIDLELVRFPAVRYHDEQRNSCLFWKFNYGFLVLSDIPQAEKCLHSKASILQPLVIREMENRMLCHTRRIGNVTFPWIKPCIAKLEELELSNEDLVIVLTFVSCIARLMDGGYVDYYKLQHLIEGLPKPVTQHRLQSVNIQSKFLLNNYNLCRIWRLHHSIPYKVLNVSKTVASTDTLEKEPVAKGTSVVETEDSLLIPPAEEETVKDNVALYEAPVQHLPSNTRRTWSSAELAILADIKVNHSSLTLRTQYELYQESCKRIGMPDRSFASVKLKLHRLQC